MKTSENLIEAAIKAARLVNDDLEFGVECAIVLCAEGTKIATLLLIYAVTRNNRIRVTNIFNNRKTKTNWKLSEIARGKPTSDSLMQKGIDVAYKAMMFERFRSIHQPNRPFKIGDKIQINGEGLDIFEVMCVKGSVVAPWNGSDFHGWESLEKCRKVKL